MNPDPINWLWFTIFVVFNGIAIPGIAYAFYLLGNRRYGVEE